MNSDCVFSTSFHIDTSISVFIPELVRRMFVMPLSVKESKAIIQLFTIFSDTDYSGSFFSSCSECNADGHICIYEVSDGIEPCRYYDEYNFRKFSKSIGSCPDLIEQLRYVGIIINLV